jgi:hypothetical protein
VSILAITIDSTTYKFQFCEVSSKSFWQALKNIANKRTLAKISLDVAQALELDFVDPTITLDESVTDLPQLGDLPPRTYNDKLVDDLWLEMGFSNATHILGMAHEQHITKKFSMWDNDLDAVQFWGAENHPHKEKISLPWHQTVGIHMGTLQMMKNEPFFLFDAIGVDKTPQAARVLLMRPFLIDFYEKNKRLPSAWRK